MISNQKQEEEEKKDCIHGLLILIKSLYYYKQNKISKNDDKQKIKIKEIKKNRNTKRKFTNKIFSYISSSASLACLCGNKYEVIRYLFNGLKCKLSFSSLLL